MRRACSARREVHATDALVSYTAALLRGFAALPGQAQGKGGKGREKSGAAAPDPSPLPLGPWAARFGCRAPGGLAAVGLECDFIGPNGTRAKSLRGAVM